LSNLAGGHGWLGLIADQLFLMNMVLADGSQRPSMTLRAGSAFMCRRFEGLHT
jgi:hypothetical protein